ncbi:MAG: ribosomal protein S18-alanine N-acetyltransferase [Actinomycetes bacterium]
MSALTLRPMRWWDIEPILDIEADLFAEDAWSAALFWSELAQYDDRHYVVATEDDHVIGYAGAALLGADAYIQTIAVTRAHWGTGLGTVLLGDLMEAAQRSGAHTVGLEVRADNARAHRLYERFGFHVIGARRGYYQPSGADAHVMVRRFSAAERVTGRTRQAGADA